MNAEYGSWMSRILSRRSISPLSLSFCSSRSYISKRTCRVMGDDNLRLVGKRRHANARLCDVSGYKTDLLEICSDNPRLHVLFIPGNPGVISFYTDFLESLYEMLGGTASVTAVGHISHTEKNWERGRLFSLQEQIDHKMDFIQCELQNIEVPILLVGHSIGSYISIEMYRRCPEKVMYCIALYPFLAVNTESSHQSTIRRITASPILCNALSFIVASLGLLPTQTSRFLAKIFIGRTCSATAVEALCTHVLQYHTMRNVLFMAMTEFKKLSETPDWAFMRGKQSQLAFLFGVDDHWGPLQMFEEISKHVPDATIAIEREGHTHAFCCTEAGSLWVAEHVAGLIKNQISSSSQ
ncbi:uncharacterized protein LOC132293236 isoform X2 [Cornus florida]|uniref:uncharacterized protein LOC132293236 isoform X2 n=1 Tax=Cornus florida TaxID=4283 RepID=UPI00289C2159|nr:uncharacterized protein LOC132293236 isoform X2 [Cornus florida]